MPLERQPYNELSVALRVCVKPSRQRQSIGIPRCQRGVRLCWSERTLMVSSLTECDQDQSLTICIRAPVASCSNNSLLMSFDFSNFLQTAYVMSFGAGKPDTQAMAELLKKAPLPHKDRETWFKALNNIPRLGPQAAHATCGSFASLGSLIQTYKAPRQWGPPSFSLFLKARVPQLGMLGSSSIVLAIWS